MAELDKVIKGFEQCWEKEPNTRNCDDCPYKKYRGEKRGKSCADRMHLDALELLKTQEIKPYIDIDEAKCPDCKVRLTRQELIGDDVLFEDFFDYCPRCGKKVRWNEGIDSL